MHGGEGGGLIHRPGDVIHSFVIPIFRDDMEDRKGGTTHYTYFIHGPYS
jgi:hypothetical protein